MARVRIRRPAAPLLKDARGQGWRQAVRVEGSEDLQEKLLALDREVSGAALLLALDKGGEVLEGAMASLAPVDSGDLSRGIGREMTRMGSKKAQIAVAPKREVWYGRFAELGTSDIAPQPFMRPALDATRDDIVAAVADELRTMLERVARHGA